MESLKEKTKTHFSYDEVDGQLLIIFLGICLKNIYLHTKLSLVPYLLIKKKKTKDMQNRVKFRNKIMNRKNYYLPVRFSNRETEGKGVGPDCLKKRM